MAIVADFAIYPPKWQAGRSANAAELTFLVGGILAQCHRNDTPSADGSANTTAAQKAGDWLLAISPDKCKSSFCGGIGGGGSDVIQKRWLMPV